MATANRHVVEEEDALRLSRLSEEVRSRLDEIGLIVSRISGRDYSAGPVRKFVPREGTEGTATFAHYDWIELVEVVPGLECCYGSIGGQTVLECPCGAG